VTDAGPARWVEEKADRAIIDAGAAVCQQLFHSSSCGYSDRRSITAFVALENDQQPLGPFYASELQLRQMAREHAAAIASCDKHDVTSCSNGEMTPARTEREKNLI